jgi:hypothetical protein
MAITKGEVKKTMAVAIGGAFGFIIALLWKEIVIGLMKLNNVWTDGGFNDWEGAAVAIISVVVITIVCIIGIIYISKWGGVET